MGLELAGWRTAWQAERDKACGRVLAERFGLPNHGDLASARWEEVEPVDVVAAGFPCPDFSFAGSRRGMAGDAGQVWFLVADAVRALRPPLVLLENVPGIRTAPGLDVDAGESALGVVLADLAEVGYDAWWTSLRASDLGAPHRRDRWFCVAALADPGRERVQRRPDDRGVPGPEGAGAREGLQRERGRDAACDAREAAADSEGSRSKHGREVAKADATRRHGPSLGDEAPADADDAGRRERGRAEPDGAEHAAAERGRAAAPDAEGRGRADEPAVDDGEGAVGGPVARAGDRVRGGDPAEDVGRGVGLARPAVADADCERLCCERESESRGVEGASGRVTDGRGEVRELRNAKAAPPDAAREPERSNARRAHGDEEGDGAYGTIRFGDGVGLVVWGEYELAIRRWEFISGAAAPRPIDDRGRLAPELVEWMLGYPVGFTDVTGVSRTARLRMLGNSVQVQAGQVAGLWLAAAAGYVA